MSEVSMQRMEVRSFKGAVSWVFGNALQALSIWYIVQVQDRAKNFSLSLLQVPANYTQPLANGCQMSNSYSAGEIRRSPV
jgi:hypothetical protein